MNRFLLPLVAIALLGFASPLAACSPPVGWHKETREATEIFLTAGGSLSDTITNLDEYSALSSSDGGTCGITTTYIRTDALYFASVVSAIAILILLPYLFKRMRR